MSSQLIPADLTNYSPLVIHHPTIAELEHLARQAKHLAEVLRWGGKVMGVPGLPCCYPDFVPFKDAIQEILRNSLSISLAYQNDVKHWLISNEDYFLALPSISGKYYQLPYGRVSSHWGQFVWIKVTLTSAAFNLSNLILPAYVSLRNCLIQVWQYLQPSKPIYRIQYFRFVKARSRWRNQSQPIKPLQFNPPLGLPYEWVLEMDCFADRLLWALEQLPLTNQSSVNDVSPSKTRGQLTSTLSTSHDLDLVARNEWMYHRRKAGATIQSIMSELNTGLNGWAPLYSESGIRDALKAIALLRGWPILKGKSGKPRTT